MLAISVELLTGRYVATAHDDRRESEWPPHPARLFSAMVAAWAEEEPPDAAERSALLRFEQAAAPLVSASAATRRTPVTHYVPVNDAAVIAPAWYQKRARALEETLGVLDAALDRAGGDLSDKAVARVLTRVAKERDVRQQVTSTGTTSVESAVTLLPERRMRQGREYPSVTPDEPVVAFIWPDIALDDASTRALDGLLERVTRLGHSSSLVNCRMIETPPEASWVPAIDGRVTLRWIGRGQLDALEAAFARHQASKPRTLPATGVRYRGPDSPLMSVSAPVRSLLSGDWFVFEFDARDRRLPATRAVDVTRALRGALLAHADELPEAFTGHRSESSPSVRPHVGFVALPFVGHQHASGRLLGAAVLLPADEALGSDADPLRQSVLRAIGNWRAAAGPSLELRLGRDGLLHCQMVTRSHLRSLQREVWGRAAREWVSVTPVALPKHPGGLTHGSQMRRTRAVARAEEQVRLACQHAGLPEPVTATVTHQPLIAGVLPVRAFPAFTQFDRAQGRETARLQVHVAIEFREAVQGPVVIGSGRYLGLGLLWPQQLVARP